jgi:hypothetical protein
LPVEKEINVSKNTYKEDENYWMKDEEEGEIEDD